MMADSQRKFDAAVHVIRSLPKSGSFQPSHEVMLKFYGYYKQAIKGPCNQAKPSFWDVSNKAKWEAWSKLGDTSKEEAMENYVNELKEVIQNVPETDQASQFITALEPFYKLAYAKAETVPPIFNIFHKKHSVTPSFKMNGHATRLKTNDRHMLSTSHGSAIHTTTGNHLSHDEEENGDIETTRLLNKQEINGFTPTSCNGDVTDHAVGNQVYTNEQSDAVDLKDSQSDNDDNDEEDDDELFCDSLGPELSEEEKIGHKQTRSSGVLASAAGDTLLLSDRNYSSFSDVEILERFDLKKNEGSSGGRSSPHSDKMVRVHFEDIASSQGEGEFVEASRELGSKESVVQPNQLGAGSGGGDNRELMRATTSGGKQALRNTVQYSDRPPRFGPRYRRRSQESDSDESPGRSDHNSSSERDEAAFDNITDILKEIQENMRKILEKLRRLETSLEQNHDSSWLKNYRPSKTFVFLIFWPIIVNFLFKFLQPRLFRKM